MKLQHGMKIKVHKHQSVFAKKNARLMIEVEIAIEIHQFCCYATPTLFFQKETHTLALTMFWLIRSYQCIAAHDVAIEKFLWTPRRRGYKFNFTSRPINTNGSEYCPRKRRKRLFVFFFGFGFLFQFACKASILIVNGYQFELSKGVALCFSFFTGFDATWLPSSQNAYSFTFCRCLLGMVPWFFTLNESET